MSSRVHFAIVARVARGIALASLVLTSRAPAAATEISLADAVRLAAERAPSLEARTAGEEAATQEALRAGRLSEPMLTIGVDNLPVSGVDAFDLSADSMTMKKIGLRQDFPAAGKRAARRALAARTVDVTQAESDTARQEVRRATAESWIAVWAGRRELAAVQGLRESAALAARVARARVAAGNAVTDAMAAEAAALELDTEQFASEASVAAAEAMLQRWVGGDAITTTIGAPDFRLLPRSEGELLAALDELPALRAAGAQVEAAAAEVTVARAERRPDWTVATSYGQRSGFGDMVMLEVGVSLPFLTGGARRAEVAARAARERAASATFEDLRRERGAWLRAAYAQWQGLARQVQWDEERRLPLARERSDVALAAYRAGGAISPWLDARRDELAARLSHARRLGELGRAWAALAFLFEEPQS